MSITSAELLYVNNSFIGLNLLLVDFHHTNTKINIYYRQAVNTLSSYEMIKEEELQRRPVSELIFMRENDPLTHK